MASQTDALGTRVEIVFATTLAIVLALAFSSGCARQTAARHALAPAPRTPSSAALEVSLVLQAPGGTPATPDTVYFVRLEPGEPLDAVLQKRRLLASNRADGDLFFLLNAAPGDYVVVAAAQERDIEGLAGHVQPPATSRSRSDSTSAGLSFAIGKARQRTHRTYFSREIVERSRVHVPASGFVFMGDGSIVVGGGREDDVQAHIRPLLEGDPGLRVGRSAEAQSWLGSLDRWNRDPGSESVFLDAASRALAGSGWAEHIARRQRELQ